MPLPTLSLTNIAGVIWSECGRLNHSPAVVHHTIRSEYAGRLPAVYQRNQYLQKLAIAISIINRHQQFVFWGDGSATMAPHFPRRPLDALTTSQWGECMQAAMEAYAKLMLPMVHRERNCGAQYYQHSTNSAAPTFWSTFRGVNPHAKLFINLGPSWDNRANQGNLWLRIYKNDDLLRRAGGRSGFPHLAPQQDAHFR